MLIRVVDFETTGMPPDAAVCEVGFCDVHGCAEPIGGGVQWGVGTPRGMLVNPGRPMPPEARAIHHIGDDDLIGAPPITTGFMLLTAGQPAAFAAHNAAFEQEFFKGGGAPWICTLKVARRLWPDCPSHTNQCLRYWLGIDLDDGLAMPPHRAAPDAYVTAHILVAALERASFADMIKWSAEPSLLPRITFGKHRGTPWDQVPADYLDWLANKSDMDVDTKFTARHHLKARSGAAAARGGQR